MIIGLMLLSVVLFIFYIIWMLFISFFYMLCWVKVCWFFVDVVVSMSYCGVVMMVFMVVLVVNIGVEIMVGSF